MKLSEKTILITGAAGRIGSSIAKATMKEGANLIINDIDTKKLELLEKDLLKIGSSKVLCIDSDITKGKEIDVLIKKSLAEFKKINSAIHCAYPTSEEWGVRFEDLKFTSLEKDLSMQLGSAIIFSQKILEIFKSQKSGDLVHISSIQGINAPKFEHYENTSMSSPIEYSAIKSGIISITKWLAKYYSKQGIRVNCVSPGGIIDKQPKIFIEKYRESCNNIGMLLPDHIAKVVVFLISPSALGITGQNIVIDDGWSL